MNYTLYIVMNNRKIRFKLSEVSFVMSDKRESESDLGPGLSSISQARKSSILKKV